MYHTKKLAAFGLSAAVTAFAVTAPLSGSVAEAVSAGTSISDMPADYVTGADWIWNNRIMNEDSLGIKGKRWNSLFDQIIANKGELNYVVRWQSTQTVTYEQRQNFAKLVEEGVNAWCDWLVGYENWPYDHVDVNIIGWAVIDKNSLQDLHDDEVVWDNIFETETNTEILASGAPSRIPCAPPELWTFNYFTDRNHQYDGQSFDEYLWCTQNYGTDFGGCGGDWGQRLSDNYYLSAISGSGFPHIYWHELGHGFGMTDFYGGEGESDGFPPGGFPGGENSIMMAGSCSYINDFDGWMLRYMWSKISTDTARFDLANAVDPEKTTPTVTETTPQVTEHTTAATTSVTTTTATAAAGTQQSATAVYDAEHQYWLVDTNGASELTIEVTGLPWAGLNGGWGYWDNAGQQWISGEYSFPNSLGETGKGTFTVSIPAEHQTAQLQIQANWYAQWDNDAQDMVDRDKSTLQFTAYYDGAEETTAVTTTTVTTTETTVSVTETTASATETTVSATETTASATETTASESSETSGQGAAATMMGDVDCSGQVNVMDAIMLARVVAEDHEVRITNTGKLNGDLNGSGSLDAEDLTMLLAALAGIQ